MFGSAVFYSGLAVAVAGLLLVVKPRPRFGVPTRQRARRVSGAAVLIAAAGLALPVSESRVVAPRTRLDDFAPVWQFHERHEILVTAPPARVFEAIRKVRADEIFLFRTLTWIRRGGRPLPPGILNAGNTDSLVDLATRSGFLRLADDSPRELVIGTVVLAPSGIPGGLTPQVFERELPPGFALATMNFLVSSAGPGRSLLSTETRVFANSPPARRRFAAYWRVIYPGSALIRRMWLRAIARRATAPDDGCESRGASPAGPNHPAVADKRSRIRPIALSP